MENLQTSGPILSKTSNGKDIFLCPQCQSYYVDEKKCDSCGLIFGKQNIKFADDLLSFFDLKDDYWADQTLFARLFPILESKTSPYYKNYQKLLCRRLKHLMWFLDEKGESFLFSKNNQYHFYRFELGELICEMAQYGYSYQEMIGLMLDQKKNSSGQREEQKQFVIDWKMLVLKEHWPAKIRKEKRGTWSFVADVFNFLTQKNEYLIFDTRKFLICFSLLLIAYFCLYEIWQILHSF